MLARFLAVVTIFGSALVVIALLAKWTAAGEHSNLYFPSNLEQLKDVVTQLAGVHLYKVLPLFCAAYLFKQAFAIPGSMLLNVLAGALFGWKVGFLLTCVMTAAGATCCYLLAKLLGRDVAEKYFPKVILKFQQQMSTNQHRLPYFLLFLRLFPCRCEQFKFLKFIRTRSLRLLAKRAAKVKLGYPVSPLPCPSIFNNDVIARENSNDCLQAPDRRNFAVLAGAANEVEEGCSYDGGCPRTQMG